MTADVDNDLAECEQLLGEHFAEQCALRLPWKLLTSAEMIMLSRFILQDCLAPLFEPDTDDNRGTLLDLVAGAVSRVKPGYTPAELRAYMYVAGAELTTTVRLHTFNGKPPPWLTDVFQRLVDVDVL